jgi:hypothetical protein
VSVFGVAVSSSSCQNGETQSCHGLHLSGRRPRLTRIRQAQPPIIDPPSGAVLLRLLKNRRLFAPSAATVGLFVLLILPGPSSCLDMPDAGPPDRSTRHESCFSGRRPPHPAEAAQKTIMHGLRNAPALRMSVWRHKLRTQSSFRRWASRTSTSRVKRQDMDGEAVATSLYGCGQGPCTPSASRSGG